MAGFIDWLVPIGANSFPMIVCAIQDCDVRVGIAFEPSS